MGIVIQKYGGTSVGTGERVLNVAGIVEQARAERPVIAVVSAMSGTVKGEGTTTKLLEAARAAVAGQDYEAPLRTVEANHDEALRIAVHDDARRAEAEAWVSEELGRVRNFLGAIRVIRELSPRSQDTLMGTGERLSAWLLAAVLRDRGTPARYVDLSAAVPEAEQHVDPGFFRRLQERLAVACRPEDGEVPVVTGFFGMVPGGLLRAVGRGYSDFTAALIAAGLGSAVVDEMQVWKEVDGIFTADPRKVPDARPLRTISPTEASELTYFGSEVLHPFTMERVVAADIPIRIANTFNPAAEGTVIRPRRDDVAARVTAVTAKRGITSVTITSNRMYNAYGFLAGVFQVLADHEVVVDLVSTSEVSISFTVEDGEDLARCRPALEALGTVQVEPGKAILAMVGEGMKFTPNTAGGMFGALGAAGINIEMISQGASEINISCVISEARAEDALRAVHRAFLEEGQARG